jgi:hypothetical protein
MTDFRTLCAELVVWADKTSAHYYQSPELLVRARAALAETQPPADGEVRELIVSEIARNLRTKAATEKANACHYSATLLTRAADLLERTADGPAVQSRKPTSVVEQPSEQELKTFACKWWRTFGFVKDKSTCAWVLDQVAPEHFADYARDVLARWGTSNLAETRSSLEPIPVTERLPGPRDCAPWPSESDASAWCWVGSDVDGGWAWEQRSAGCLVMFPDDFTHWLPAQALPLPSGEVG